jgi:hypothetical protein
MGALPRPGQSRAVPPGSRRRLRLPGGSPDARQPAVRRRAQLGGVPAGHGQRPGTTPAFSWISPNLCDDGHDAPCVTGAPGGLAQADAFLSQWVPKIMATPAYRDGGLIVITFDEGSDSAACCGEASGFGPDHPNVPLPGKNGPGGGRIGAVLLSPDQARHPQHRGLQPLLAAAHRGGHLRPAAPGRRGHAAGQIVRPGRIRLGHAVNHFGIGAALGVSHENTAEQNMDQLRRMWSGRQPYRDSSRLDCFIAGVGSKDESRRRRQVQVALRT